MLKNQKLPNSSLHLNAAAQIVPVEQARTARRHLSDVRPRSVSNLQRLHQMINSQVVRKYTITKDGERLLSFANPNHTSVVLTTRRQLSIVAGATLIQADATYKIMPRGFGKQLFTIHASCNGFVSMMSFRHAIRLPRWITEEAFGKDNSRFLIHRSVWWRVL